MTPCLDLVDASTCKLKRSDRLYLVRQVQPGVQRGRQIRGQIADVIKRPVSPCRYLYMSEMMQQGEGAKRGKSDGEGWIAL